MGKGVEDYLISGVGGILKALHGFLGDLASKEIGLLWNAKDDLRKLYDTLEVILASVSDAEKQQVSDEVARLWLKRLKDIAYDAEDVVDEIAYETMRQHVRGDSPDKKLLDFFSPSNHLVFSYEVAKKVQDINKRLDEFTKNNKIAKFPTSITTAHNETSLLRPARETSSRVSQSIIGRESDKSEIIRILITSKGPSAAASSAAASSSAASSSSASNFQNNQYPEKVSVVSIVGMGGVGKTTLAGDIFKDKAVKKFDPKIWVWVGGDFVARTVFLEILNFIDPGTKLNNSSSLDALEKEVEKHTRGKKYLLVLDDMWNVRAKEWEKLARVLAVGDQDSKVLITSREDQKSVNGGTSPYKLKKLRDDECWSIIETKAFSDGGAQQTDDDMIIIGKEIAKKCMGLPLAAQSLGSLMHSNNNKSDWEMIRDDDIWNDKEKDDFNVIPILKLSYDKFPSEIFSSGFGEWSVYEVSYPGDVGWMNFFQKNVVIHNGVLHWIDRNSVIAYNLNNGEACGNQCRLINLPGEEYRLYDSSQPYIGVLEGLICYACLRVERMPMGVLKVFLCVWVIEEDWHLLYDDILVDDMLAKIISNSNLINLSRF